MVGSVSVISSSMVDSKALTSLCFEPVLSCFHDNSRQSRYSFGRKRAQPLLGSLELSSSFLDKSYTRDLFLCGKNLTKKKRNRSLVIVNELAGQYDEDGFDDVKSQLIEYFTYKAVKTVLVQLYEMNPPQYMFFYKYVALNDKGYGKGFIRSLAKVEHTLAERVMITRLHLYGKWIKECDHAEIYQMLSDQNLELMRQRLIETVVWPSEDDSEVAG